MPSNDTGVGVSPAPRALLNRDDILLRRLAKLVDVVTSSGTVTITGGSASSMFSGGESVINGGTA